MGNKEKEQEAPEEEEAPKEESSSDLDIPRQRIRTMSMIEEAGGVASRMEKAAARMEAATKKAEIIAAENTLMGRAMAGGVVETKEQTDEEYAQDALSGKFKNEGQK